MKLRSHLMVFVLVTVVPVLLFATALIVYNTRLERAAVERGMRDTARALALALDLDIRDIKTAVRTLASSRHLDPPSDLRRFYDEAATVSQSFRGWAVLSDPNGRQVLNTSRPFGAVLPVPSPASLEMMKSVATSRETFVSNVFVGTVSRRPAVIVAVPVIRDDEVRYVLDFPFTPARFTNLLQEAELSPGWIAMITDREGGIVARVPDAESFVGRQTSPLWLDASGGSHEGFMQGRLLSDAEIYAAFRRSRESGWVIAVAAPRSIVDAPLRRSMLVLSGGGALLVGAGAGLGFVLGKRIARPIVDLADSLRTSRAAKPPVNSFPVREVEELRHALDEAATRARLLIREQIARSEAEAANKAKDDFLAMLSHELRTPLGTVAGWVRMLRSGRLDAPRIAYALEVIERSVKQQSRLIADLLDTSRIASGKLHLNIQHVDLPPLVESVVDALRPSAEAKNIALTATLDRSAGPVRGDPERLRQVLENLLTNALKFTPHGGRVTVRLVRDDDARVIVEDTGMGISSELLPHVFERFRQADSASTRAQGGLGLGLAIVRHLVDLHGGRITVASDGDGQGSTFIVELPIEPAHDREVAAAVDGGAASVGGSPS